MKKLLILLLLALSLTTFAQEKQVAILEPIAITKEVSTMHRSMVRGEMVKAIGRQSGYAAFTRTDIDQIMSEQNFQQSGMVDDATRKRIGAMQGVDYVCVTKITKEGNNYYLEANLVNIETGKISNPATQYGELEGGSLSNMLAACEKLAAELVGKRVQSSISNNSINSYNVNQNFTETAWGINMKMIWVEGGDFLMGCTSEQGGDCGSDEQNVRRVTVDGFYIGMLEVTQSQWEKVVGTSIYQQRSKANTSNTFGVGPDYPMYHVSWNEAMEFCRLLSNKTGKTYTLPTEAQWEYAARGGNKNEGTKYAGSHMIDDVAWHYDNSGGSSQIVGSKRANALGIYDMSGNVFEWCKDWYADSYVSYDTNNPVGPSSGTYRVTRGGSWNSALHIYRVANRHCFNSGRRGYDQGFRVVCIP